MPKEKNDTYILLCEISKATSLQQIADISYEILGNPIFIQDRAHITLAYTKKIKIEDEQWQRDIINRYRSSIPTSNQSKEVSGNYEKSIESGMPTIINDANLPYTRMVKTLMIHGVHVASMVLTAYCKPIEEEDVNLMEIISSFIKIHIRNEKYYLTNNEYAIENFLVQLLNGEQLNWEPFKEHARLLNWPNKKYNYLLAVNSVNTQPDESFLLQELLNQFRQLPKCLYVLFYDDKILCIFGFDESIANWEKDAPEIDRTLKEFNLIAGVSRCFQGLKGLHQHYLQANYMMKIGFLLEKDFRFYSYDENAIYHLVKLLPKDIKLKSFCHSKILLLEAYDLKNNTELIPTLQVFLENQKSVTRTAKLLYIHRNTVIYRVNKCIEVMHTPMEESNEMFSFIFSLRVLEYCNKQL